MNLNERNTIKCICKIIKTKTFLTHLDISWTSLGPKQLMRVSRALKKSLGDLKELNLSYNALEFN